LKFRVGEASPEVGTQYRDLISNLSAQYNFVATQVRSPKEMKKEPQEEQLILAEQHLQELRKNLDTIGQWIYLETANQVCAY
jgi:hypothetical protein